MKEVKQYLIIREDLNMSTGKIAAQVAHASSKIFFDKMKKEIRTPGLGASTYLYSFEASEEEMLWVEGQFTKIVKKVKNENQLLKTYNEAKQSGLNVSLILDAGLTELEGENYTAIAIGPNYIEDCEPIVKKLRNL
jgi:PTH2 family peptidyl-tRNA hydrolase